MVALRNSRNTAMEITAAGIEVANVKPTRRPRYTFAAVKTSVMIAPMMTPRSVSSRRFWPPPDATRETRWDDMPLSADWSIVPMADVPPLVGGHPPRPMQRRKAPSRAPSIQATNPNESSDLSDHRVGEAGKHADQQDARRAQQ